LLCPCFRNGWRVHHRIARHRHSHRSIGWLVVRACAAVRRGIALMRAPRTLGILSLGPAALQSCLWWLHDWYCNNLPRRQPP
jgi:hypothetical protein